MSAVIITDSQESESACRAGNAVDPWPGPQAWFQLILQVRCADSVALSRMHQLAQPRRPRFSTLPTGPGKPGTGYRRPRPRRQALAGFTVAPGQNQRPGRFHRSRPVLRGNWTRWPLQMGPWKTARLPEPQLLHSRHGGRTEPISRGAGTSSVFVWSLQSWWVQGSAQQGTGEGVCAGGKARLFPVIVLP